MKDLIKFEYLKLDELTPYERNTRSHDRRSIDSIKSSINETGMNDPIGVWGDKNIIVEGHGRYLACRELGIEIVPVLHLDYLTDEERRKYAIAHNRTTELSQFNQYLKLELDELNFECPDLHFEEINFKNDNSTFDNNINIVEDEVPEVDEENEPITKQGDIWQLGNHRLMCGDSTDKSTVELLMDGKKADLVFTDPPYGMKKEKDGVLNDNLNYDDLLEFNKKWIPLTFEYLKDMGGWYCWGIDEPLMDIYSHILKPLARKNQIVIRNYLTWAKHTAFGMNSSLMLSYPRETEKCWFVVKGANWNNNNAEFFNYKYQPVVDYLNEQTQIVGLNAKKLRELTGVQMWSHWFTHSQFTVIPEKHYKKLQEEYNKDGAFLLSYAELRELIVAVNDKKQPDKPYFDLTWFDDGDIPLTDVWRNSITTIKERENTGGHATPKPLKICERGIVTSTKAGEIVLDLFGGSGSTLIACEQLNRKCYMMELDPKYCDVIIKRWETLTGKKAKLVKEEKND